MPDRTYKAKILLFGEYTIIFGSHALAVPVGHFQGKWDFTNDQNHQSDLKKFGQFLEQLQQKGRLSNDLDVPAFLSDLGKGLYFDSTIPQGYGAGSSGALCAAVFDRYSGDRDKDAIEPLKTKLARIEQYFHGSSSGIDPLVSYLGQAVLIRPESIKAVDIPLSGKEKITCFLLDTKIPRKTAPLVDLFLKKCKNEHYKTKCTDTLGALNKTAIRAFLDQDSSVLYETVARISRFQFEYFAEMIPESFKPLWKEGINNRSYQLKLCGAGGGGFIIGFTEDFNAVSNQLTNCDLIELLNL